MRPIWDWCPESTPVAAANGWAGLPNGVTGICAACSSRGPGRSCAMPTAVKTGCHVGPDRLWLRIGKHKAAVAVANKPCLLQAGGPHHLVNAVSRRRVPAGLRHAHRPV